MELVMIVKDAENSIKDTLQCIKKYISHYTITDTGSTDKTIEIIKQELQDVKGELYSDTFSTFTNARNKNLERCFNNKSNCKYLIELDDSYQFNANDKFNIDDLKHDCYQIEVRNKETSYYSTRIRRKNRRILYNPKYQVHEKLDYNGQVHVLSNCFIFDEQSVVSNQKSLERYNKDITLMIQDLKSNNDPHIIYHLAKTFKALASISNNRGYIEQAMNYFRLLSQWKDYEYKSLYNIALLKHVFELDSLDNIIKEYHAAYKCKPMFEPLYKIGCEYYRRAHSQQNSEQLSYTYKILYTAFNCKLFADEESNVNEYYEELPCLLSTVLSEMGHDDKAIDILVKANANYTREFSCVNYKLHNLLESMKSECNQNEQDSKDGKQEKESKEKTVVIHMGNYNKKPIIYNEKENNIHSVASGSEIMAINLARELSKTRKVIVFGNIVESKDSSVNNLSFYNYNKFTDYMNNNYTDVLIVSRSTNNLYYKNVNKVYLWLHDIVPDGNVFHTHETKFKGVICLTEWHKQYFCDQYKFPPEKTFIIGNAIDMDRFSLITQKDQKDQKDQSNQKDQTHTIIKTPLKFIYSSCPTRGLDNLVKVMTNLKKEYDVSLSIFCDESLISSNTLKEIKSNSFITLNKRVSQERLSKEYLSSDIWLYPTDFKETFCITALEAQAAKVLCICRNLAGLKDTVKNGVLFETNDEMYKKIKLLVNNPKLKQIIVNKQYEWAKQQTIENKTIEWIKLFNQD